MCENTHFETKDGSLHVDGVSLEDIAARYGTPTYAYSAAAIKEAFMAFTNAFTTADKVASHLVCYAVKANSNLAVLGMLAGLGAGFDVVSVGELERVVLAGGDPSKVVFSGVGKRVDEMERALALGIHCFNVESVDELRRLSAVAARVGKEAPVSLRVNPDVDAKTHPYISTGLKKNKFGVALSEAYDVYMEGAKLPSIKFVGVACHIGSQLLDLAPLAESLDRLIELANKLRSAGIELGTFDLGGGVGVQYKKSETAPSITAYVQEIILPRLNQLGWDSKVVLAPGRSVVANAGVLLARIEHVKTTTEKTFVVVDTAMNDLLRPALYGGYHEIVPVVKKTGKDVVCDVVGPVCETGDFLGKDRDLRGIDEGDLLAVMSAGAYGASMASNYNSRGRAAEVLVLDGAVHVIRARETIEDLVRGESLLPM